jgi:hypothetical protein
VNLAMLWQKKKAACLNQFKAVLARKTPRDRKKPVSHCAAPAFGIV